MRHDGQTKFVLPLSLCAGKSAQDVGGKANGLGRLMSYRHDVPDGFAISTRAYEVFVEAVRADLAGILASPDANRADRVRALFHDVPLPGAVAGEICAAYLALGSGSATAVAIRSSAADEDGADASFAGQQDTYLWVRGEEEVLKHVKYCWASLFTGRAVSYRDARSAATREPTMAVIVQEMVAAECSGVMMTLAPSSGDRSEVHIEAGLGLGEAIVRGEVSPDVFRYDVRLDRLREARIGNKRIQYTFRGTTMERESVDPVVAMQPSMSEREALVLARLGCRVAAEFGRPMDIEWAVDRDERGHRRIRLLQARPETVWTARPVPDVVPDPLTHTSDPLTCWTRSNVGEAAPGVMTPLSWDVWRTVGERAIRDCARVSGALSRREAEVPADDDQRYLHAFHGRIGVRAQYLATLGDRLPGTTGEDMIRGVFGRVPDGIDFEPTRRRYPFVLWGMTTTFISFPSRVRRLVADYDAWWSRSIAELSEADAAQAIRMFHTSLKRFYKSLFLQSIANILIVTPVYLALEKLVHDAGAGDTGELSGAGHAEIDMIRDLWEASRGRIDIHTLLSRHGFHGPLEGDLSSSVWREDPTPLHALVGQYRQTEDGLNPVAAEARREQARRATTKVVLAALPRHRRPFGRLLLRFGRTRIPMRGLVKRSYLQALDVARASARRIGELLVNSQRLDTVDDVFFLSIEELTDPPAGDLRVIVDARRAYWQRHTRVEVPTDWQGTPFVVATEDASEDGGAVNGVGVSGGVVEGRARVLLTPDFTQVRPGEILVAPTTDPSWSTAMFVSAGLVVDIGGALSHAAVVARELGVPCVVNTRVGTRRIRTGDLLRVDGGTGKVELLNTAEFSAKSTDDEVTR